MCGIAALVSKNSPLPPSRSIDPMLKAIKHRGPDDTGCFSTDYVRLGMTRLSILDLKSPNLCPLTYTKPGVTTVSHCLSYNGELYNFKELRTELTQLGHIFCTTGDTEVVLHSYLEWGDSCLDRFNGMFAFVLLDLARDRLFAARDIAGEKPLYFCNNSEGLLIASEIKAILTQIPTPECNITREFEAFEYMTGDETLFKGVFALRPGHKLVLENITRGFRTLDISEFWNIRNHLEEIAPENAVDRLDELLSDSVAMRLQSDVPLGLYLSGGLDSSLLAALAKPEIVFSVTSDQGPKYDEIYFARLMAQHLNCQHVVIEPTKVEFETHLDDVLYHLDVLTGSFSSFPLYMLARKAREYVKIVISGEGADELFSGYARYILPHHDFSSFDIPELANYRSLLEYYYGKPLDRFARLLNRGNVSDDVVSDIISPYFTEFKDLRHAMGYTEFKLMLVTLLHMEDRAASAFGLENRSPFLDKRIIAFAYSIPGELKIKNNTTKWIVKEVAKRYVPSEIVNRKTKLGLISPINLWLNFHGRRGEFDRSNFNQLCMNRWKSIFFDEKRFNFI